MPRFHCPGPLASGLSIALPAGAARHVQVLRLQPGAAITLFNGEGGEFEAVVQRMGRSDVFVQVGQWRDVEREAPREVHLAVGMPANERMDWLVEKAAELGVASIQPLVAARTVLKLNAERAEKKRAHWQGIAIAACEQCGRNRVPVVYEVMSLERWLAEPQPPTHRLMLSLDADAAPLRLAVSGTEPVLTLSGPEGGFTLHEQEAASAAGFVAITLGPRVLRAETAPLALLAALTLAA